MPLDTDIANADAHLHVEFYESSAKDYAGFVFVRIMTPGDKTNIFDQPAKDEHKERFPRQWLHFQMRKSGVDMGPIGTALELWHEDQPEVLGENRMLELQILKFQTVEQIALASDAQLQRIGMGGPGLRDAARAYLSNRNQSESAAELADTKAQLAALQKQMGQMMEMMQAQQNPGAQAAAEKAKAQVQQRADTAEAATARPRKAVPDGQHDAGAGNAGNG